MTYKAPTHQSPAHQSPIHHSPAHRSLTHRNILLACPLFRGFTLDILLSVLPYLKAQERSLNAGEKLHRVYRNGECFLCLSGKVGVFEKGHRITSVTPGDLFGAENLLPVGKESRIALLGEDDSTLFFFSVERLLLPPTEEDEHPLRDALQRNLFYMKSIECESVKQRLACLSPYKVRDRLFAFFRKEAGKHRSRTFPLRMTLSELSVFLSVNRSSLSTELMKMKSEGLVSLDDGMINLISDF